MERTYRIVVGVDGSEVGQRALDWAVAETQRRSDAGQPTTVQAITVWHDEWMEPIGAAAALLSDPAADAAQTLNAAVSAARALHPRVPIAGEVVHGDAAEVLTRASDDADLLVVGSHRHSRIFAAVMGSVAEACVRGATCPVIIMPASRSSSHTGQHESVAVYPN